jgi:hypothetical protein
LLLELLAPHVPRGIAQLFRLVGTTIVAFTLSAFALGQTMALAADDDRDVIAALPSDSLPYANGLPAVLSPEDEAR